MINEAALENAENEIERFLKKDYTWKNLREELNEAKITSM